MEPLAGVVQHYAWGSTRHLAELRGEVASDMPEAELWFGAHPSAPSVLSAGATLLDIISADPRAELGDAVVDAYGPRLPFLLKLLAAAEPLSIQVHPSIEQAIAGFAREDSLGIARDAPNRSFRDENHKPELIVALTTFEAMVGFREVDETLDLLDVLNSSAREALVPDADVQDADRVAMFASLLADGGLPVALEHILSLSPVEAAVLVSAIVDAARVVLDGRWAAEADLLVRLAAKYPGDAGVLTALLLNRVLLQPGEGIYLDAGQMHAYVEGFGVEIMANSDNVLRGGLTPKHMDVKALSGVVLAEVLTPRVLTPVPFAPNRLRYETPAPDFELVRLEGGGTYRWKCTGPEIVIAVGGSATLRGGGRSIDLSPGDGAWIRPADGEICAEVDGLCFVASVGVLH